MRDGRIAHSRRVAQPRGQRNSWQRNSRVAQPRCPRALPRASATSPGATRTPKRVPTPRVGRKPHTAPTPPRFPARHRRPAAARSTMLSYVSIVVALAPPPRVAVFGGSGFLGSRVCKSLVGAGCARPSPLHLHAPSVALCICARVVCLRAPSVVLCNLCARRLPAQARSSPCLAPANHQRGLQRSHGVSR